jgi:hypothetical protein
MQMHLFMALLSLSIFMASSGAGQPTSKPSNPLDGLSQFISKHHEKPAPDAVPQQLKTHLAENTLAQLNPTYHRRGLGSHSCGALSSRRCERR